MTAPSHKPLMRSLGEFFGHIVKAVRADPGRKVVRHEVEEEQRGDLTLRRTTIEEVEVRKVGRNAETST
jgi:hypothetical protein